MQIEPMAAPIMQQWTHQTTFAPIQEVQHGAPMRELLGDDADDDKKDDTNDDNTDKGDKKKADDKGAEKEKAKKESSANSFKSLPILMACTLIVGLFYV